MMERSPASHREGGLASRCMMRRTVPSLRTIWPNVITSPVSSFVLRGVEVAAEDPRMRAAPGEALVDALEGLDLDPAVRCAGRNVSRVHLAPAKRRRDEGGEQALAPGDSNRNVAKRLRGPPRRDQQAVAPGALQDVPVRCEGERVEAMLEPLRSEPVAVLETVLATTSCRATTSGLASAMTATCAGMRRPPPGARSTTQGEPSLPGVGTACRGCVGVGYCVAADTSIGRVCSRSAAHRNRDGDRHYERRYPEFVCEIRADVEELLETGQMRRARELTVATGQAVNATVFPMFFTGDLDAEFVLVHLNPKQDEIRSDPACLASSSPPSRTTSTGTGTSALTTTARTYPGRHYSRFDRKQITLFVRPFGVIDFVEETSSAVQPDEPRASRRSQAARWSSSHTVRRTSRQNRFTAQHMRSHFDRVLRVICARHRRDVFFCGGAFDPSFGSGSSTLTSFI